MQNCSTCGANQWSLTHRVKPVPKEVLYVEAKTGLPAPEAVYHKQQQCLACHNWQDLDLPEGWKTRAAHAAVYSKAPGDGKFTFCTNYSFKTIADSYAHSRRLVLERIEELDGYVNGHISRDGYEYRIEVKHTPWITKSSYANYYYELDGWQAEREYKKRKEKTMAVKSTMRRKYGLDPVTPVVGGLYEATSGTYKYIVLCTDARNLRDIYFEGVVVWSEDDAKWGVGKVFKDCSRTGYKEFTGSITLANLDD